MTDWADGIETRNYGIRREIDVSMLSELMRTIIALAMVAGVLLFYSWVRSQIVNTGYESQSLFAEEQSLLRTQEKLILEEEVLRNPARIDDLARNNLGMTLLRPNQLVMPQIQDAERNAPDAMAMAEFEAAVQKRAALSRSSEITPNN